MTTQHTQLSWTARLFKAAESLFTKPKAPDFVAQDPALQAIDSFFRRECKVTWTACDGESPATAKDYTFTATRKGNWPFTATFSSAPENKPAVELQLSEEQRRATSSPQDRREFSDLKEFLATLKQTQTSQGLVAYIYSGGQTHTPLTPSGPKRTSAAIATPRGVA